MAATFVSDHHGGPTLLYALLIGMAFHFLAKEETTGAGIAFAGRSVLRIGVALLGLRISIEQIVDLGMMPIVLVVGAVAATVLFGRALARVLGLARAQGVLTGGAVAICGASAAMAIAAVLPRGRDHERDTLFTVIAVTTLSTAAMVFYPLLVRALGLDDRMAGIFLGATIHDVAQVVGAGYLISDEAGTIATFTKLLRVAMLVPAVLIIAWAFGRRAAASAPAAAREPPLPLFLIAFVAFVVANSLGWLPAAAVALAAELSRWCLVVAIAALGARTALQDFLSLGWRPVALVVAETVFLAVLVLAALRALDGASQPP